MKGTRYKPVGWKYESWRHSLAAKGIPTSYYKKKFRGAFKATSKDDALRVKSLMDDLTIMRMKKKDATKQENALEKFLESKDIRRNEEGIFMPSQSRFKKEEEKEEGDESQRPSDVSSVRTVKMMSHKELISLGTGEAIDEINRRRSNKGKPPVDMELDFGDSDMFKLSKKELKDLGSEKADSELERRRLRKEKKANVIHDDKKEEETQERMTHAERVQQLEKEGLTTSDAQAIADIDAVVADRSDSAILREAKKEKKGVEILFPDEDLPEGVAFRIKDHGTRRFRDVTDEDMKEFETDFGKRK